jgi:Uncharacterized protein conserved in bacteria
MAKDEFLEEPLFREIDEDLRRDKWMRLWKRYRGLLFAAVVGILVAVAGSQVWLHYQLKGVAEASVQFADAQALAVTDAPAALAAFQRLAADGPEGYALLARLQAAALLDKQGDRAGAIAAYQQLAKDAPTPVYRDLATLLGILVELDASSAEITNREAIDSQLARLAADASPWRYSARELQALQAFAAGHKDEAERIANALIADQSTPAGIRNRARMLLTQTGQS